MAAKKTNGHDSVTVEMVDLLRQLVTEVRATNERLDTLQVEVSGFRNETRNELTSLRTEMRADLAQTNDALEDLRREVAKLAEDRERFARLEARLDALERRAA